MGVNARIPQQRQSREPRRQDPYRTKTKPRSGSICTECGAVNLRGRWERPKAATRKVTGRRKTHAAEHHIETICPACRQLEDRYASGVVELHGERWKESSQQIDEMIRNTEEIARSRNDQERILWTRTWRGVTKYYVSLPELARQIGRTLGRAFKGKVEYHRSTEEPYLRVVWHSDRSISDPHATREERRLGKSRDFRGRAKTRGSRY